jgi:hypothetical protein
VQFLNKNQMLKEIWNFFFKVDFGQKHGKIISTFAKAAEDAKRLEKEMGEHIEAKEAHIAKINAEIATVNAVKEQSAKFSRNLSKLIGNEEVIVPVSPVDDSADGPGGN